MRPIISYDDIAEQPLQTPPVKHQANTLAQPPAKKRKMSQNQRQGGQGGGRVQPQHWDDPGKQGMQVSYDDAPVAPAPSSANVGKTAGADPEEGWGQYREEEEEEDEDESRELAHEEIWDDSALIEAWNSAAAEYDAYHGPGKKWKEEPVNKSPLWYNVPPAPSKAKAKAKAPAAQNNGMHVDEADPVEEIGGDSAPLNFDTFVPVHDPSLAAAATVGPLLTVPAMDGMPGASSGVEVASVSQDEAFSRAMSAMYWSGYWTAVYHCRRHGSAPQSTEEGAERQDGVEEDEENEELLPAQR
ncbi:hypothetical protein C8Q80DRAFT_1168632 [Daedaleopsis nitida]|nr:hypothetical protein C8Q80DRAFT_1168632 [Daedaleopsis nitida]